MSTLAATCKQAHGLNLHPGRYDPVSGSVLIDGIDARTLSLDALRAASALVPQACPRRTRSHLIHPDRILSAPDRI